ncbi:DUF1800 domain-containing protein [Chloroflexi bacterium TSY]|nr:DUF1800 domain-containing protein [Chloroflexi bacterium TSY]
MILSRRSLFMPRSNPRQRSAVPSTPILHLLNRITWGARPEEVQQATEMGYEAMLDEQLNPETIDDTYVDRELKKLPILSMDRFTAHSLVDAEYRCHKSLVRGMLLRAVHGKRQLLERMVEFWSDHFNIPSDEYAPELPSFQREVIRRHALGNFQELLVETAKSPAMLLYLDNYVNIAKHPNENYARELMELHTMGVDGGYTETDVKEVARAFTGWTIHLKTRTGFYFDPEEHDVGEKLVLGHRLPAKRGIEDAFHVLRIVARHPSTAQYICRKLCLRFVSDDPPQSLIDQMASIWQQTEGDIKSILRVLFLSTEFQQSVGQKLRRPLDFFVGALRATGTTTDEYWQLEQMLDTLGQMPYGWKPPNGYPDIAGAWSSTSGMLARWNVAMKLTHGAYSDANESGYGLTTQLRHPIGDPQTAGALVDAVATQVFGTPVRDEARIQFIDYATDGGAADTPVTAHLLGRKLGSLYGLMLASPYYQWR